MLWGSIDHQKQISEGQFFCLQCNNIRHYVQARIARYFTLFSIPLFKTNILAESVECQECKNIYELDILTPSSQEMFKMVAISKRSLQRGNPLDEVKSQLIEAGANTEIAEVIVKKVLA